MRCKICKTKFEAKYFNQKSCLEPSCIIAWKDKVKADQWKKDKKKMKQELETVQELVKLAQKVFNSFIRERDKDKPCISCGVKLTGKYDAGHYHNANNHWFVRFDENNVHGQCVKCNQHLHGNLIPYRKGLIDRIGEQALDELDEVSNNTANFSKEYLRELIKTYRNKLKELKK